MSIQEENKRTVQRFNQEFLEAGNLQSYEELLDKNFINQTALPGFESADGMLRFMENFRKAFTDIKVEIAEQIAEGNLVTTRKTLHVTHVDEFMGASPSGKRIKIPVIDIVRVVNGKMLEHWGIRDMREVFHS